MSDTIINGIRIVKGGIKQRSPQIIPLHYPSERVDYGNTNVKATLDSLKTVAFSGSYNDLTNKPTIPAAQIQSDWNQTNTASKDYIKNKPIIPNGAIYYGTCTSQASNQIKAVTISAEQNFSLVVGAIVFVKFDSNNTYNATESNPVKLKVNNTTEKNIYYAGSATPTGTNVTAFGKQNYINQYIYDGTCWIWQGSSADNNTTYSNMSMNEFKIGTATAQRTLQATVLNQAIESYGTAYGTCATVGSEATKVITIANSDWKLRIGAIITVKFTNTNTASNVKLNVNSTGAKSIYYGNAVYTGATNWVTGLANVNITYMYDGTYWIFIAHSADNDVNDRVTQTATTTNSNYEVLFSATADNTTRTETARKNNNLLFNPSTGNLQATTLTSKIISAKIAKALIGTGTAGSDAGSGVSPRYIPSLWTFNAGITVDNGEVYLIKIPVAGGTYGVWLSLDNGANYHPVAISNGKGRFTTHYGVNTVIAISYESAGVCTCYARTGADTTADVTGCFRVLNDYDANTTYSNMSASELTTGTATNARSISAKVLSDWMTNKISGKVNDNPTFTQATTRANIASGESFATILGKISKYFVDLKDLAFIAKDGTSSTKYLRGDGTWQTFPTIPEAQIQSDWNQTDNTKKDYIKNKPSISTVNNAKLTIQKNGTTVKTFTANASTDVTCNITVPTTFDDLTGTVAIGNGGTGATTRLNALKNLTNEDVGTNATYFLTITNSWGKGGYTSVANVKTVLGLGSLAYKNSLSKSDVGLGNVENKSSATIRGELTKSNVTTALGYTPPTTDTNTTYTLATGDSNGQIKVTPSSGTAYNVNVKGLGSAAYYNADTSATASTVVVRDANKYIYATYYNSNISDENINSYTNSPAIMFTSNDKWIRRTTKGNLQTWLGLGSLAYKNSLSYSDVGAAASSHTHSYLPLSGGTLTGGLYGVGYYFTGSNMGIYNNSNWINLYNGLGGVAYKASNHDFRTANDAWNNISALDFIRQSNSSRKVKENIRTMTEEEANKLLDVNVVSFDYKKDAGFGEGDERKNKFGVIAEEINELLPYVVNYDRENNLPTGVNYERFVPHLIKMVQMLKKEINDLKAVGHNP